LNINTFKKLCLKANTENADKIHDYYIKLEMIYNELMKEEFDEQKKEIAKKFRKLTGNILDDNIFINISFKSYLKLIVLYCY